MPHGSRDWYQYRRNSSTYPVGDLAELAARLGSPSTFDRGGDILWLDDFEHGLRGWLTGTLGAGASVAISPVSAKFGGYSVRMVGGSDGIRQARIQRNIAYPFPSIIAIEVSFTLDPHVDYVQASLYLYDGATQKRAVIRYNYVAQEIRYRDENNVVQTLATNINLTVDTPIYHTIKLVADFPNTRYHRLVLDNHHYDLTHLPLNNPPNPRAPYLNTAFHLYSIADENAVAYVDGYILTQDET